MWGTPRRSAGRGRAATPGARTPRRRAGGAHPTRRSSMPPPFARPPLRPDGTGHRRSPRSIARTASSGRPPHPRCGSSAWAAVGLRREGSPAPGPQHRFARAPTAGPSSGPGEREAARAAPSSIPAQCLAKLRQRGPLQSHCLANHPGQRPVTRRRSEVEEGPWHRGDGDPSQFAAVALEGRASVDTHAPVAAGPAAAWPGDRLEGSAKRPEPVRRGAARVAEDAARGCQDGPGPAPPLVVRKHRRDAEYALLHRHVPAGTHAAPDRVVADPKFEELPPRDAIELPRGKLRYASVAHTPTSGALRDVRPP
jgi:hypothetical protein